MILLLGVAGDALERWNALGHRLAVEAGLGPAIWDLAQTNGEGAGGSPNFEGRIFRFARERDDHTVGREGPVHRGDGRELETRSTWRRRSRGGAEQSDAARCHFPAIARQHGVAAIET